MSAEFPGFTGGESGASYEKIIARLDDIITEPGKYHAVGLLVGRPSSEEMQKVMSDLDYFHNRSDTHISLFCIGYTLSAGRYQPIDKHFDVVNFTSCMDSLESQSSWRYSGETDLLLLGAYKDARGKTHLDFTTVIVVWLEQAIRNEAIPNTKQFIEQVIQFAKYRPSERFAFDLSDELGLRKAGSWLKEMAFEIIERLSGVDLSKIFGKVAMFCVKDLSTKELERLGTDYPDEELDRLVARNALKAEQAERAKKLRA
jgi:hypothetical protein